MCPFIISKGICVFTEKFLMFINWSNKFTFSIPHKKMPKVDKVLFSN